MISTATTRINSNNTKQEKEEYTEEDEERIKEKYILCVSVSACVCMYARIRPRGVCVILCESLNVAFPRRKETCFPDPSRASIESRYSFRVKPPGLAVRYG